MMLVARQRDLVLRQEIFEGMDEVEAQMCPDLGHAKPTKRRQVQACLQYKIEERLWA
jgi:hypothetical protein